MAVTHHDEHTDPLDVKVEFELPDLFSGVPLKYALPALIFTAITLLATACATFLPWA